MTESPQLVITAAAGSRILDLRDLWQFRDLLYTFAERDFKLRYRQTALGIAWVVLQPVLAAAIFAVVFHAIGNISAPNGLPYFVVTYTGMVLWQVFSLTLTKTSSSLVQNAPMISKVYFPRLILPLSMALSTFVDCFVGLMVLFVLMAFFHITPPIWFLLFPVWLLLTSALALGIGLYFGALMVKYRDVQYVLPVVTQLLLYASPVGYTLSQALAKLQGPVTLVFLLNPLSGLLELFRSSMLGTDVPPLSASLYSVICTLAVLVAGVCAFRAMERNFADVI